MTTHTLGLAILAGSLALAALGVIWAIRDLSKITIDRIDPLADDFDPIDTCGDDHADPCSGWVWARFDAVDRPYDHRGQL